MLSEPKIKSRTLSGRNSRKKYFVSTERDEEEASSFNSTTTEIPPGAPILLPSEQEIAAGF